MAASFALRIHVPAEPHQLFLQFKGTPLRLDTVTSGPTRAVGPRHSTTTSPTFSRADDGTPTPTQRAQPTSEAAATNADGRLPVTLMSSSSATADGRLLPRTARERNKKARQKARQKTRQDLLAEASRFPESVCVIDAGDNPSGAVPVEPAAVAGPGPVAFDPAIGSLRGQLDTVGGAEEDVAQDAHAGPEIDLGTPPTLSTPLPPAPPPVVESRRQSLAMVERTTLSPTDSENAALTVRCQCGTVSFSTPNMPPVALYHCHCTECQKQSASAFGTSALYPADALFPLSAELALDLKCWTRPTDSGGRMHCYFCPNCGSRLFHRIVEPDGTPRATVSIKAGCIEGLDWHGGKHIYTRSAVVDIPDGAEKYDTLPGERLLEDPVPANPAWNWPDGLP